MTQTWQLGLGGEVIATIVADSCDWPWTYGTLVESPAFERYRPYFSDPDSWPESADFDALLAEVRSRSFWLRDVSTGEVFRKLTLNHDGGNVVWFRYGR